MQLKNNPQRTCIACRSTKDKGLLIRIVKDKNNNFSVDKLGKLNGRGAYICNSNECLEKAIKTRALNRTFKCEINNSVYETIKEEITCNK
mgnify:CR=1 FL=1